MLVLILTFVFGMMIAAFEDVALGIFTQDWRLWLINGFLAALLALAASYFVENSKKKV